MWFRWSLCRVQHGAAYQFQDMVMIGRQITKEINIGPWLHLGSNHCDKCCLHQTCCRAHLMFTLETSLTKPNPKELVRGDWTFYSKESRSNKLILLVSKNTGKYLKISYQCCWHYSAPHCFYSKQSKRKIKWKTNKKIYIMHDKDF
jgi:hypothetical protein